MKSKDQFLGGRLSRSVAVIIMLAVIATATLERQPVLADSDEITVLPVPPTQTANWWQWALGIPATNNPLLDQTGANCAVDQSGDVWRLGGTFNQSGIVNRKCSIPLGKSILFPLVNTEVDELDTGFLEFICGEDTAANPTVPKLRACAQFIANQATDVTAIVDGKVIASSSNMDEFRVLSPPFKFDLPEDDILGLGPAENVQAVSDGFWVQLAPLLPGKHKIEFGGTLRFTETLDGKTFLFEFTTKAVYRLTVE